MTDEPSQHQLHSTFNFLRIRNLPLSRPLIAISLRHETHILALVFRSVSPRESFLSRFPFFFVRASHHLMY